MLKISSIIEAANKYHFYTFQDCVTEFKKLGGVIPLANKAFFDHFKKLLKNFTNQFANFSLATLAKKYCKQVVNGREFMIDLEHICNVELKLASSNQANGYILQAGGGHLAGTYEALAEAQLVEILKVQELPGGATLYELQNIYKLKDSFKKTTFPQSWSVEKIAQAVQEVYLSNANIKFDKFNNPYKVKIIDGCNVQISLNSRNINGKIIDEIVSAYPALME